MTTILAIWGVLKKFVAAIPWQVWACLGLILFGGWLFSGGSCRDFVCRRTPRPPKPPHTYTITGTVGYVIDANLFTMWVTPRRVRSVTIAYVVIAPVPVTVDPDFGPVVDQADLEPLYLTQKLLPKGKPCSVVCEGRRLLGSEATDAPDATDDATEALEGRSPIVGVVTGPTGADVGLELIRNGFATATEDAPAAYKAAEKAAKKPKNSGSDVRNSEEARADATDSQGPAQQPRWASAAGTLSHGGSFSDKGD